MIQRKKKRKLIGGRIQTKMADIKILLVNMTKKLTYSYGQKDDDNNNNKECHTVI
jgi:hypothetical protein